jgi:hypothetical protein
LQILLLSFIKSINSSGKSFGCGEVNLNLTSGAIIDNLCIKSVNLKPSPSLDLYNSLNPGEFL